MKFQNIFPKIILVTILLIFTAFIIGQFFDYDLSKKYFSKGEDTFVTAIAKKDPLSPSYQLYQELNQSQKDKLNIELLQHQIQHPTILNNSVLAAYILILCFTLIYFYYNFKYKELENKNEADPLLNKDRKEGFPYIYKTIIDLDKSILKYNLIGSISLIITFSIVIVLTIFIFDLFKGTLHSIDEMSKENLILGILLIVLRTSLLGSFILLFVVHMIKFTRSSFDQAVRFNKRKHATLFLVQLFEEHQKDKVPIPDIMQAFREWNVTVDSAFTDKDFDKEVAKNAYDLLGKFIDKFDTISKIPPPPPSQQ